jgi:hypothetical protein
MRVITMDELVDYCFTHLTQRGYVPGREELEDTIDVLFMFLEEEGMADTVIAEIYEKDDEE